MALFSEYAVTPDVYNESCYESPTLCEVYVRQLQKVFLSEGIVRDLRNSEWQEFFSTPMVPWYPKVRLLLKNLTTKGRLVPSAPALRCTPKNDREWCKEALASHENLPLNGIIVSGYTKNTYRKNTLVESVKELSSSTTCTWWSPEDGSIRLKRNIDAYKDNLKLILRHANSIMFVDPYIDPERHNYTHFIQLLKAMGKRNPKPRVEIHRKIPLSSEKTEDQIKNNMEISFRRKFKSVLKSLKIKIFVWDDFHDRYLISNLGGISIPNGFDTSNDKRKTTWTRLGRRALADVEREFDRTSQVRKLRFTFKLY